MLKVQERLALKIEGGGPLGKLVVEAGASGGVRGYLQVPDAPGPALPGESDVTAGLGTNGYLTVVKDLRLRDLYRSVVALGGRSPDKEVENYLNTSEQIPSWVQIGVRMNDSGRVAAAGGILIQTMPGSRPEAVRTLVDNLAEGPGIEVLLADGVAPEQVLERAFGQETFRILETYPVAYKCTCSRERSEKALAALEEEDLLALIAEGVGVVDCHFCHARYEFSRRDIEQILAVRSEQTPPDSNP
jgi:molecular chaperone Hsp33